MLVIHVNNFSAYMASGLNFAIEQLDVHMEAHWRSEVLLISISDNVSIVMQREQYF